MTYRLACLLTLLSSAAGAQGFDTISFWIGQGARQAAFAVDWDGPGGQSALVWGICWDGDATAGDLLTRVARANPRLSVLLNQEGGYVIGIGYDQGPFGFATNPEVDFSHGLATGDPDPSRVAVGPEDLYAENTASARWTCWQSASGEEGSWTPLGDGSPEAVVPDGSWIGLSHAPVAAPVPVGVHVPAPLPLYSGPVDTAHPIDPAIVWDDPRILGWASGVALYHRADGETAFSDTSMALGPPGTEFQVVSLGDLYPEDILAGNPPGSITLIFDVPLGNGPGFDLAVYENGFPAPDEPERIMAELAYVEVSTNGIHFARFPAHYYASDEAVGGYSFLEACRIYNLAGKHGAHSYDSPILSGTPFDLDQLRFEPDVLAGLVDLNEIRYVRVVDIPGNGDWTDAHANPVYDSWPTWGSGGFDLNAVAVMNQVQVALTVDPITTDQTSPALIGVVGRDDVSVTVSVDGAAYAAVNDGSGTWTLAGGTLPPLAFGNYEVRAEASHPEWGLVAEATGLLTIYDSEFRARIKGPAIVYRQQGAGWTFVAEVNGGVEPVSYQWYRVVDGEESALPGGQSMEWTLDSAGPCSEGGYFIEITDADGNTVRSGVVMLCVMKTQQVPLSWMALTLSALLLVLMACRRTLRPGCGK